MFKQFLVNFIQIFFVAYYYILYYGRRMENISLTRYLLLMQQKNNVTLITK